MASSPVLPTEDQPISLGIDDLHISLQAEQEDTQKKTFTCWINSQLAKHDPPSVISDLFTDIKRGTSSWTCLKYSRENSCLEIKDLIHSSVGSI